MSESRCLSLAKSVNTPSTARVSKCLVAHSLNQEAPLTSKVGDKIQQDNTIVNNFPSLQFPFTTYNTVKKKPTKTIKNKPQTPFASHLYLDIKKLNQGLDDCYLAPFCCCCFCFCLLIL